MSLSALEIDTLWRATVGRPLTAFGAYAQCFAYIAIGIAVVWLIRDGGWARTRTPKK